MGQERLGVRGSPASVCGICCHVAGVITVVCRLTKTVGGSANQGSLAVLSLSYCIGGTGLPIGEVGRDGGGGLRVQCSTSRHSTWKGWRKSRANRNRGQYGRMSRLTARTGAGYRSYACRSEPAAGTPNPEKRSGPSRLIRPSTTASSIGTSNILYFYLSSLFAHSRSAS